jgi:hypothetical protein
MRTIDTSKINLLLIATSSTGVPIGFRELLPDEYPTNGDLFDTHSGPNNDFFDPIRPRWGIQKMLIVGGKSKVPYGTPSKPPAFWFKHYRVLEVPDAVPEGYGVVTGGTLQPGDFAEVVSPLSWAPVHPNYYGQRTAVYLPCKTYRKQPAFPVAASCVFATEQQFACALAKKQFVFDRDYKSGCDTLQQDLRDVRHALKSAVQDNKQLDARIEAKDAIIRRTSDDCIALSNSLTEAQVAQYKLNCEVSDLKARIAELAQESESWRKTARALQNTDTDTDTGVGEGYRELLPDEIPQPTDEWSYLCASTNDRSSWKPRSLICKETYGELLSNAVVKGFKYRRKLPVPGPAAAPADAEIGEGYRELCDAELPQPGDEFSFELRDAKGDRIWVWNYRGWASTSPDETYGRLKRELGAGLRYRRKVRAQ